MEDQIVVAFAQRDKIRQSVPVMDCKAQEIAGGYIEKIVPLGQQRGQGNEQGERVQGKANR